MPTATDIDISISNWRLYLLLSSKYRFTDNLTELSDPEDDTDTISFELAVEHNKSFRANPLDKIPELIIGIEIIPNGLRVAKVQTLFKQLTKTSSSLTVTITASAFSFTPLSTPSYRHILPWKFGFDFDLNSTLSPAAFGRLQCTCMIFSAAEPAQHLKTGMGLDTPERAFKWEKGFKANSFSDLGNESVKVVKYGKVEMWRLAAVGHRTGAAGLAT
jgi:hypothetical protein